VTRTGLQLLLLLLFFCDSHRAAGGQDPVHRPPVGDGDMTGPTVGPPHRHRRTTANPVARCCHSALLYRPRPWKTGVRFGRPVAVDTRVKLDPLLAPAAGCSLL
jgi:hypothetical protein